MRPITALSLVTTAALVSALAASPASAQTVFDFSNLRSNNLAASFTPTAGGSSCTGGDICSTRGGSMTYSKDGYSVSALGYYNNLSANAMVVQDHENAWDYANKIGAGLGVYHEFDLQNNPSNTSDDNITTGEMLKMTFSEKVTLMSIGLRSDGHNTSWVSGAKFQYSLDGTTWTTGGLTGLFDLNVDTKDFWIRYSQNTQFAADQFYLASMTVSKAQGNVVTPEPASFALSAAGLLGIGLVARRRRQR